MQVPEVSAPAPLQAIPDFPGFINHLTSEEGYGLNPCPVHCPDRDGSVHAHLQTPDGDDMIAWADGHWSDYDLTQPARLIYPAARLRRDFRGSLNPAGPCYRTEGGLAVHVQPDCRCLR